MSLDTTPSYPKTNYGLKQQVNKNYNKVFLKQQNVQFYYHFTFPKQPTPNMRITIGDQFSPPTVTWQHVFGLKEQV